MNKNKAFTTEITISIYQIHPYFNDKLNKTTIQVEGLLSNTTQTLKFDSASAKPLYAKDGDTVIGYNT